MSWSDPKSKKDLQDLIDKRTDGKRLSNNEKYELDQARKKGVTDLDWR